MPNDVNHGTVSPNPTASPFDFDKSVEVIEIGTPDTRNLKNLRIEPSETQEANEFNEYSQILDKSADKSRNEIRGSDE